MASKIKRTQIDDGEYILTATQHAAVLELLKMGPGEKVDLSPYARRDSAIDKSSNQKITGSKTFTAPVTIPLAKEQDHAMNMASTISLLASYSFLKIRGTFGDQLSTTGGDLPVSVTEFDAYLCITKNVKDGYYSINGDKTIFEQGDLAIGLGGKWYRVSGGNAVVKINGYQQREVNLKFSDLVDVNTLSIKDDGKVLGVKVVTVPNGSCGAIKIPMISAIDNAPARSVLYERVVSLKDAANSIEIAYQSDWLQYSELLLIAEDILVDDRHTKANHAFRFGWCFKDKSGRYLPISNFAYNGFYTTQEAALSNKGGKASSSSILMANSGQRCGLLNHLNALVEGVDSAGNIARTAKDSRNPNIALDGMSLNAIGDSSYSTFINAAASEIGSITFKMSVNLKDNCSVFKGKLKLVGIK